MPWRRDTKVVADLHMISAKRAGDISEMGGIKSESQTSPSWGGFFSSTGLVGLLLGLLHREVSSFSVARRGFLDGWLSAEVVAEESFTS